VPYFRDRIKGHEIIFTSLNLDEDDKEIFDADIICPFVNTHLSAEIIRKFKSLKLIATMSTGFDHIDLEECRKMGIIVCNVPSYGSNTVAEHTFGLILNLTRNIHKAYRRTRYENLSYEGLMGTDINGKTLGVIGTGRIGVKVISIAKGFNMNVIAYDPYPKQGLEEQLHFRYVSVDELLSSSDIVTLHLPLNEHTHHLIDEHALSRMKQDAIIINTARGGIIETEALVKALKSGHLGGAGLDVLEGELMVKEEMEIVHSSGTLGIEQMKLLMENHALMKMPNVLITPHLAFYSKEAVQRIMDTTLQNLFDLIENRGFPNQVNK